ncbi:MAG: ATP-binding cassette domain-containing protein, partial [Clostridia bacterium]
EGGFNHSIAQGGVNISGGQKQRLSIARALAGSPKIYIFDDSFSSLDFQTESKLKSALASKTLDSTVILITQRVSTIMNADQIIVLDAGKVVGMGKHNDLLSSCRVYYEIASSQLTKEELV